MSAHSPSDGSRDKHLSGTLSEAEAAFMDAHSGTRPNADALVTARIRSELERHADRDAALDVEMVADLIAVSTDEVRDRLADRTLYSYESAGCDDDRLIPPWQFVDGKEVPHLSEVINALPAEFTPGDVRAFVLNARIDDPAEDKIVALRDWLLSHADPATAVDLARDQNYTI